MKLLNESVGLDGLSALEADLIASDVLKKRVTSEFEGMRNSASSLGWSMAHIEPHIGLGVKGFVQGIVMNGCELRNRMVSWISRKSASCAILVHPEGLWCKCLDGYAGI